MKTKINIDYLKIFFTIFIVIIVLSRLHTKEHFHYQYPVEYIYDYPYYLKNYRYPKNINPIYYDYYQHYYDPIYGYPTRFYQPTRYMTQDLRCHPALDEPRIAKIGPWGESVLLPPYREKCLKMR